MWYTCYSDVSFISERNEHCDIDYSIDRFGVVSTLPPAATSWPPEYSAKGFANSRGGSKSSLDLRLLMMRYQLFSTYGKNVVYMRTSRKMNQLIYYSLYLQTNKRWNSTSSIRVLSPQVSKVNTTNRVRFCWLAFALWRPWLVSHKTAMNTPKMLKSR